METILKVFGLLLLALGCFVGYVILAPGHSTNAEIAHDFSTPEGALLKMEDAFINKDLDAAMKCFHFRTEAQIALKMDENAQQVVTMSGIFKDRLKDELSYEMPDLTAVKTTFSKPEKFKDRDDLVKFMRTRSSSSGDDVEEVCCVKIADGWRVVRLHEPLNDVLEAEKKSAP